MKVSRVFFFLLIGRMSTMTDLQCPTQLTVAKPAAECRKEQFTFLFCASPSLAAILYLVQCDYGFLQICTPCSDNSISTAMDSLKNTNCGKSCPIWVNRRPKKKFELCSKPLM